jgi:hypothetical protein
MIIPSPHVEGVFGPEVLLNVETGEGCLRSAGGVVTGPLPSSPATNAFLVWVGFAVLVVSEGVRDEHVTTVASKLRTRLQSQPLPIVFSRGQHPAQDGVVIITDAAGAAPMQFARAEGYALVQAAWHEGPVTVHVDGTPYTFEVSFTETTPGHYAPSLR